MNLESKIQTFLIFSLFSLIVGLLPLIFYSIGHSQYDNIDPDDYVLFYLILADIIGLLICGGLCPSYGSYLHMYLLPISLLLIGWISCVIFIRQNKNKE